MTPDQLNAARTAAYIAARARWADAMGRARGLLEAGAITWRFRREVLHGPGQILWNAYTEGYRNHCHLPHGADFAAIDDARARIFDRGGLVDAYLVELAAADRSAGIWRRHADPDEAEEMAGLLGIIWQTAYLHCRTDLGVALEEAGLPGWSRAYLRDDYSLAVPAGEAPDA